MLTSFGGIFSIVEQFDYKLSFVIYSTLGLRRSMYGYPYRCILTSDHESSVREITEFYNLCGGK